MTQGDSGLEEIKPGWGVLSILLRAFTLISVSLAVAEALYMVEYGVDATSIGWLLVSAGLSGAAIFAVIGSGRQDSLEEPHSHLTQPLFNYIDVGGKLSSTTVFLGIVILISPW